MDAIRSAESDYTSNEKILLESEENLESDKTLVDFVQEETQIDE